MKTKETNLMYIEMGIQSASSTKMVHALKDELRKYDHHVIAAYRLDKWLDELRALQTRLSAEHAQWKPCKIVLNGTIGGNVRWLYFGKDFVATIDKVRGELTD